MAPTHSIAPVLPGPGNANLPAPELDETLRRASALPSDGRPLEVSRLPERWQSRSFVALIVGEFKRGKSTLLNALIRQDLLPTGVPPVTVVPTRVRCGLRSRAVAHFRDGAELEIPLARLRDYVDESRNPGNHQSVVSVDIDTALRKQSGRS